MSTTSLDYTWKHSILRSHAEVTLSNKTCRSTWKWSDEQDDWWYIWFIFIVDWMLMHWSDDKIDTHTETDQTNMKSSLKKEI